MARPSIEISAEIVGELATVLPELFPGAPDLEGPTKHKQTLPAFTAQNPGGRYLHYGIREHAMGSMMNGIVAHHGSCRWGPPTSSSPITCARHCAWRR